MVSYPWPPTHFTEEKLRPWDGGTCPGWCSEELAEPTGHKLPTAGQEASSAPGRPRGADAEHPTPVAKNQPGAGLGY